MLGLIVTASLCVPGTPVGVEVVYWTLTQEALVSLASGRPADGYEIHLRRIDNGKIIVVRDSLPPPPKGMIFPYDTCKSVG